MIAATTVVIAEEAREGPEARLSGPNFRVQINIDVRESCVEVIGELRPQDCHLLRDAVMQLVLGRPDLVAVDLTRCSQMALSGLALLRHAAKVARRLNTELEVRGVDQVIDGQSLSRRNVIVDTARPSTRTAITRVTRL